MHQSGPRSITVLETQRILDSSNYQVLIEQAQAAYEAGHERLVVDLRETGTISMYGFFALYLIVSLFNNTPLPSLEQWLTSSPSLNLFYKRKTEINPLLICNPQPHIAQALYSIGFQNYADIKRSF